MRSRSQRRNVCLLASFSSHSVVLLVLLLPPCEQVFLFFHFLLMLICYGWLMVSVRKSCPAHTYKEISYLALLCTLQHLIVAMQAMKKISKSYCLLMMTIMMMIMVIVSNILPFTLYDIITFNFFHPGNTHVVKYYS